MNPKATSSTPILNLDADCIKDLAFQYGEIAKQLASNIGLKTSEIHISNNSLSLAFSEAATD